jgi:hypothetical protein
MANLYPKTKCVVCTEWARNKSCPRRGKCKYLHAYVHPERKRLCYTILYGGCKYGENYCYYQHIPCSIKKYEELATHARNYTHLREIVKEKLEVDLHGAPVGKRAKLTKTCTYWKGSGCNKKNCSFLHAHIEPGKSGLCTHFSTGKDCRHGADCEFQHVADIEQYEKDSIGTKSYKEYLARKHPERKTQAKRGPLRKPTPNATPKTNLWKKRKRSEHAKDPAAKRAKETSNGFLTVSEFPALTPSPKPAPKRNLKNDKPGAADDCEEKAPCANLSDLHSTDQKVCELVPGGVADYGEADTVAGDPVAGDPVAGEPVAGDPHEGSGGVDSEKRGLLDEKKEECHATPPGGVTLLVSSSASERKQKAMSEWGPDDVYEFICRIGPQDYWKRCADLFRKEETDGVVLLEYAARPTGETELQKDFKDLSRAGGFSMHISKARVLLSAVKAARDRA